MTSTASKLFAPLLALATYCSAGETPASTSAAEQNSISAEALAVLEIADTFQSKPSEVRSLTFLAVDKLVSSFESASSADTDENNASAAQAPSTEPLKLFCEQQKLTIASSLIAMPSSISVADIAVRCNEALGLPTAKDELHLSNILKAYQEHFPGDRPWLARPITNFGDLSFFLALNQSQVLGMRYLQSSRLILEVYEVDLAKQTRFSSSFYDLAPLLLGFEQHEQAIMRSPSVRAHAFKEAIKSWKNTDSAAAFFQAFAIRDDQARLTELQKIANASNDFAALSAISLCLKNPKLKCQDSALDDALSAVEQRPSNTLALLQLARIQVNPSTGKPNWQAAIKLVDRARASMKAQHPNQVQRANDAADYLDYHFAQSLLPLSRDSLLQAALDGRVGFALAMLANYQQRSALSEDECAELERIILANFDINKPLRLRMLPPAALVALMYRAMKLERAADVLKLAAAGAKHMEANSLSILAWFYESDSAEFAQLKLAVEPATLRARAATAGSQHNVAAIASQLGIALKNAIASGASASEIKRQRAIHVAWLAAAVLHGNEGYKFEFYSEKAKLSTEQESQRLVALAKKEGLAKSADYLWLAYADAAMDEASPVFDPAAAHLALKLAVSANQSSGFVSLADALAKGLLGRKPNLKAALKVLEQGHKKKLDHVSDLLATMLWTGEYGKQDRARAMVIWDQLSLSGNLFAINNRAWMQCISPEVGEAVAEEMTALLAEQIKKIKIDSNLSFVSALYGTQAACFAAQNKFDQALLGEQKAGVMLQRYAYFDDSEIPLNLARQKLYQAGKRYMEAEVKP